MRLKKTDAALIALLCALASASAFIAASSRKAGTEVIIKIDGKEYKALPLNVAATLDIPVAGGGFNRLVIENGEARITDADCNDKLCVKQGGISRTYETIVCLPNKITVEVYGGIDSGTNGFDAVAE